MHSNQELRIVHRKETEPFKEKFYDSLEEDNSDSFSLDSLECRNEKAQEERSLASGKHRKKRNTSAAEGKADRMSKKDSPKGSNRKTDVGVIVPFYKGEMTVTHIHKIRKNDCKVRNKNMKATTTNSTKQKECPVKDTSWKSHLPYRKDEKRDKSSLGHRLIQTNYFCSSQEEPPLKSNGTLCTLMTDLSLSNYSSRSFCSETIENISEVVPTRSYASLHNERNGYLKNYIKVIKRNCLCKKLSRNVSYLQKYQERKYRPSLSKMKRQSPEGSSCSTFGDSTVCCLNNSDLDIKQDSCSSCENDDESLYIRTAINNMDRSEIVCTKPSSISEVSLKAVSECQCSPRRSYVPYKTRDYRALILPRPGRLGPDHTVTKEKYDRRMLQKEYGNRVSKKNLLSLHRTREETQLQKKNSDHLHVQLPFQPVFSETTSRQCQKQEDKEVKAEPTSQQRQQEEQKKQRQRSQYSVKSDREKRDKVNRKQKAETPSALLKTLQNRHLKEVQAVEIIRQQMK